MTEEEYLAVKDLPEIPMTAWYEYYRDRGGSDIGMPQFEEIFTLMLFNKSMVNVRGIMKQVTFQSALKNFYNYYNTKFGLV